MEGRAEKAHDRIEKGQVREKIVISVRVYPDSTVKGYSPRDPPAVQ